MGASIKQGSKVRRCGGAEVGGSLGSIRTGTFFFQAVPSWPLAILILKLVCKNETNIDIYFKKRTVVLGGTTFGLIERREVLMIDNEERTPFSAETHLQRKQLLGVLADD